ncbi:MAG: TrmH family RNA methyltransferase [Mangrovibacterium sp.]
MISRNKIKYIQSLHRKKERDNECIFLVEGDKSVKEALQSSFTVRTLCATSNFIAENNLSALKTIEIIEVNDEELKKISTLQNPQHALAIVEMPAIDLNFEDLETNITLALDGIQDPGNLGTIIRTADWFGIENIYCSVDTADCFNPKVIQASMGALFRVKVHYLELIKLLEVASEKKLPSYGTFLEGENIYESSISKQAAILVMGNEGNGISAEVADAVSNKIHIPNYANSGSESLNVAIATAICLAEFRRV